MPDELETSVSYTKRARNRDLRLMPTEPKDGPDITKWEIVFSPPLIEHKLAADREIVANGLVTRDGATMIDGAYRVKGKAYAILLGKTITRTDAGKPPTSFTPTPDKVNGMPDCVLMDFAVSAERGVDVTEEDAEKEGE